MSASVSVGVVRCGGESGGGGVMVSVHSSAHELNGLVASALAPSAEQSSRKRP